MNVRITSYVCISNCYCLIDDWILSLPFSVVIKEQILWYAFDTQMYEHTLLLGDELPHSNNYLVEMISPVSSIEMSGAHVLIPEPLHICIFDKDCKRLLICACN